MLLTGEAYGFSMTGAWIVQGIDLTHDMVDVTNFGRIGRQMIPTELKATATITQYRGRDTQRYYEQARETAIERTPDDTKRALEALFELDEAMPEGYEAVAEVCQDREDGKRFIVTARRKT